jgi:hypothetical protein
MDTIKDTNETRTSTSKGRVSEIRNIKICLCQKNDRDIPVVSISGTPSGFLGSSTRVVALRVSMEPNLSRIKILS